MILLKMICSKMIGKQPAVALRAMAVKKTMILKQNNFAGDVGGKMIELQND